MTVRGRAVKLFAVNPSAPASTERTVQPALPALRVKIGLSFLACLFAVTAFWPIEISVIYDELGAYACWGFNRDFVWDPPTEYTAHDIYLGSPLLLSLCLIFAVGLWRSRPRFLINTQ